MFEHLNSATTKNIYIDWKLRGDVAARLGINAASKAGKIS